MFMIKRDLLLKFIHDKRIANKINKAKTWTEVTAIINEESKRLGLKVVEI